MSSATWNEGQSRSHMSAQAMDEKRKENVAYEYLCHLEEARVWMGKCLEEELPAATELEPALTNGVILAKLAHFFAPNVVNKKKIYDIDIEKFKATGLHFKHTDNINFWLHAMKKEGLPSIFYPTTTDIYDRKNIPKTIYCLHALGIFLHRQGKAPPIQDLVGEAEFTQEEISQMQRELDEQNIQMPAFGKIGGILADTSPEEEAEKERQRKEKEEEEERLRLEKEREEALAAAHSRVNELIGSGDLAAQLAALQDPLLDLGPISEENMPFIAKALQAALAANGGEPLSIDQFREAIAKGNADAEHHRAVEAAKARINDLIMSGDLEALLAALQDPILGLGPISEENMPFIVKALQAMMEANGGAPLSIDQFKEAIAKGNADAEHHRAVEAATNLINELIMSGDLAALLAALQNPVLGLGPILEENMPFIVKALQATMEANGGAPLSIDQFKESIAKGNADGDHHRAVEAATALINDLINSGDLAALLAALQNPILGLGPILEENLPFIAKALQAMLEANGGAPLSIDQFKEAIAKGNADADHHRAVEAAVTRINDLIMSGDQAALLAALQDPLVGLGEIREDRISFIQKALQAAMELNGGAPLSIDQFKQAIAKSNADADHHGAVEAAVTRINDLIMSGDLAALLAALQDPLVGLGEIREDNMSFIQKALQAAMELKGGAPLSIPELKEGVEKGNADADHFRAVEKAVKLVCKLAREGDLEGLLAALADPILGLGTINPKDGQYIMKALQSVLDAMGGDLTIDELKAAIEVYDMAGVGEVQVDNQKVNISSLQKFLHLLEATETDYEEEREIQRIKQSVVSTIRNQQELEENLNIMDIKIGLLVKNRLDLDAVVHQQTKLKKKAASALGGPSKGLKSLSKESRAKLEGYQHLFYALQTHPNYLARLIFQMPGGRTTRFIENVIFTLFNYASNQREEYLLMNLFESALKLELKTMDDVEDIAKGNATVIKMVITFNRGARGVSSLKELILPLVNRVMNNSDIKINVNPVEVYKSWINQKESETGESCGMPYDVSTEQALSHKEVQESIDKTVKLLKDITEEFVNNLCESYEKIPYGIRYFSMRLREALKQQFPNCSREDILKVVGNLLYYRFMNPAVVAPDAFDIVELSLDKGLTNEQRRNLGSIAKVLHHASANRSFDGENSALSPLNAVIESSHQKFLKFFELSSQTADAETHYNQDKYAEVKQLAKPVVYISVKEICNTHKLLLEHEEHIADDEKDILHQLLKDLGPVPEIHDILGEAYAHPGPSATPEQVSMWEDRVAEGGKSEISLTLKSSVNLAGQDDKDKVLNVFVQTKRMAAGLLRAQPGQNLKAILETEATAEQEEEYVRVQERNKELEKRSIIEVERSASNHEMVTPKTPDFARTMTIKEVKEVLKSNLDLLEKEGLVDANNNYQAILNSMAKDIRNQHRHRQQRKKELEGLMGTLSALEAKGKYYEDQREYYQMYVDACLSNLTKPKNKKETTRKTIKYNAAKLHDKGVLLEIEGLSPGQFKGVTFEIEAAETGKFNVYAKFMGVSMEKIELVFEDLLQLQYEGVAVFKMYGCAKINVNLLVFLINKKFYGT